MIALIVLFSTFFIPIYGTMVGMGFTTMDGWPTGVTNTRIWDIGVAWREIHLGVDVYDWSRLDAVVAQIEAIGSKATYVIGATPQWLAKYPDQPYYAPWLGPGSNSMPYDVDEFNKFVWNLSTRYRGRISAYEIWNEPQLSDFLYPYTNEELNCLATMTSRAYSTIKSCDGAAMVLAASVLPRASSGGMSKASTYLTILQQHGWNVDAFTTHIYPENGADVNTWHSMLIDVKNTLASMSPPTMKIWITETLYNLNGPVIPESDAPKYVNGTYDSAIQEGVQQLFWYAWNRPDLGGLQINSGSTAWAAIRDHA